MEESVDHRRDGQMRRTHSQQEVETRSKNLISRKLKRLIARYDGSAATSEDFQAVFEEVSGRDLDAFFQTWLWDQVKPPATWTLP